MVKLKELLKESFERKFGQPLATLDSVMKDYQMGKLYTDKDKPPFKTKKQIEEELNERSNPSDKKELLRALKNSKVADVFSLNNDELVIEMTSPSNTNFVVGNIRKYKGD